LQISEKSLAQDRGDADDETSARADLQTIEGLFEKRQRAFVWRARSRFEFRSKDEIDKNARQRSGAERVSPLEPLRAASTKTRAPAEESAGGSSCARPISVELIADCGRRTGSAGWPLIRRDAGAA
jgi:hypothetical protein